MPSTFRYVVCDVFTDTPLAGNQLAVFTDARELPEDMLQPLAREMNFSETVFVYPAEADGAHARIRIFTPAIEVPFAGHPTLGSAFVLGRAAPARSRSGSRRAPASSRSGSSGRARGSSSAGWSSRCPRSSRTRTRRGCSRRSASSARSCRSSSTTTGCRNVYVALPSEERRRGAPARPRPARAPAARCSESTASPASGPRWKTRMFIPSGGVAEDPATGSAAGPLALHLARHGRIAFGDEIEITQGVEIGRPSKLYARVDGSAERVERVEVGGSAVVVARGEFRLQCEGRLASERDRLDLRQLEGEAVPEAAAVAGEVEAVARRVEDEVRVVGGDRDRPAGGQAAARLAPGRPASWETTIGGFVSTTATIVEPAAAAATTRGSESGGGGGVLEGATAGSSSSDGLFVEVDDREPVRRLDVGDHGRGPQSRSATSGGRRGAPRLSAPHRRSGPRGTWRRTRRRLPSGRGSRRVGRGRARRSRRRRRCSLRSPA